MCYFYSVYWNSVISSTGDLIRTKYLKMGVTVLQPCNVIRVGSMLSCDRITAVCQF